jgi:zinc D-Ala-D-Ala carboxypeptidase
VSRAVSAVVSVSLIAALAVSLAGCAPDREIVADPGPVVTAPPVVETPTPTPTPAPEEFDKTKNSIDDPSSYWVVVNKLRPLDPQDFAADDLVPVPIPYVYAPTLRASAATAVVKIFDDFEQETGLTMQAQSAYRSYGAQVGTYNGWVSRLGQKGADLTSARPGHSEHQTGLAIDISALPAECSLKQCFADTPQGKWLAKHAWEYGFILRYPEGMTDITGYEFEPWHYRFVGKSLAKEMYETKTATLEEFFDLGPAPDYAG